MDDELSHLRFHHRYLPKLHENRILLEWGVITLLASTVSTPFDAEYQTIYLNRLKEIKDAFLFLFPKKTKTKNTALYVSQLPSPCIRFSAELTHLQTLFSQKRKVTTVIPLWQTQYFLWMLVHIIITVYSTILATGGQCPRVNYEVVTTGRTVFAY